MNTWPSGRRHAMSQSEHNEWNAMHYPGTRQMCTVCDQPTERCEEDTLYVDDPNEALCKECYDEAMLEARR